MSGTDQGTRSSAGKVTTVPVIAFHAIEEGPAPLCCPPAQFAQLVATLHDRGAVALTAGEAARRLADGASLPDRPVVFSFDDGYASVHDRAWPILAEAGYVGTLFAVTGRLGGTNDWDGPGAGGHGLDLMAASELRALHSAGWEIGGHSHTHRSLTALSDDAATEEIVTCRDTLHDLLGAPVPSFAYPYGHASPRIRRIASEIHPACFGIGAARASSHSNPDFIERIEAWYLRSPWTVAHLHDVIGTGHLAVRRGLRRVRQAAEEIS